MTIHRQDIFVKEITDLYERHKCAALDDEVVYRRAVQMRHQPGCGYTIANSITNMILMCRKMDLRRYKEPSMFPEMCVDK